MGKQFQVSEKTYNFIEYVHGIINHWHDRPLIADHGVNPTLARLRGLAADMIRLIDNADGLEWDVRDIVYEAVNGPDGDADEDHVDWLLSTPVDDLDHQFDRDLCMDDEGDDVAQPMHDGVQHVGDQPTPSALPTTACEQPSRKVPDEQ